MTQLILSEEQAKLILKANGPVQMCDSAGNVLGQAQPNSALDQMDDLDRRAVENHRKRQVVPKQNGYSSEHVRNMLIALEQEWKRTGGFDKPQMDVFLGRWRAENPQ